MVIAPIEACVSVAVVLAPGMDALVPTFFDYGTGPPMTTCDGTMTYEEFEWHILRLVYEEGLDRLQPSYLAYALGMTHDQVTEFLEEATTTGLLEMDVLGDGRIEYRIPGLDRARNLPSPIWKEIEEEFDLDRPDDADVDESAPVRRLESEAPDTTQPPSPALDPPPQAADADQPPVPRADGVVDDRPGRRRIDTEADDDARQRLAVAKHPHLPSSLRDHIEARYASTETAMMPLDDRSPIVGTDASVDDPTSRAMTAFDNDEHFPFRIEATDDTYCDPTQTVFMRQIRVHGVDSEQELRHHVQRLFESFGYRIVQAEDERLRFERGSVTFILALVPLFVLVLPLFVYLFLYCMGRSTIHQEPVELDVQFRRQIEDGEPVYEIDLTFIGLHGVVLGAADQRVLNQEIDTLRDELRWSLSPG